MDNPDLSDILARLGLDEENIHLIKTLVSQLLVKPRRSKVQQELNRMLPHRVKELRESNGLSQRKLALKLGISSKTYNHYETGKTTMKISVLNSLADFFKTTTDYLMGRTDLK